MTQWVAGEIAFGTWRRHVGSWLAAAAADPRVLLLRYEDMIADLAGCVARLSAHLGLGYSDAELGKLLPRMTFAWMKEHEAAFAPTSVAWVDKADGFSFVRRGKVGGGKEDLTAAQRLEREASALAQLPKEKRKFAEAEKKEARALPATLAAR